MTDLINVIEHCYSFEGDTDAWLRGVTEAAAPLAPLGKHVVAGMVFQFREGLAELPHIHVTTPDGSGTDEVVRRLCRPSDPAVARSVFSANPVVAFASKVKGHPAFAHGRNHVEALLGYDDVVGVRTIAEPGRGVVLTFPLWRDTAFGPREIAAWQRIAMHVGTGLRLHDRMQTSKPEPEAILSPSGKVEHAEEAAKSAIAREQLARATRAIDKARGKLRRVDPQEALELWRCLVDGTWTLIDTFDSDGRRYVVAHRNKRSLRPALGEKLTDRERDVLARLADGHTNKLIGYELGLSASTVGTLLQRAAAKLGASSRAELVAMARTRLARAVDSKP